MAYSVLQTNLEAPPVEALKRAFRSVRLLTDYDAHTLAADAFGILVKHLTAEDATALQGSLRKEHIETEIVEESRLPSLPPCKLVQRLDCLDEGLIIYDPLGREFKVEWNHVTLIAAGRVRLTEFNRIEKQVPVTRYTSDGFACTTMENDYRVREVRKDNLILELLIGNGVMRYAINAKQFNFTYLDQRQSKDATNNFCLMIGDICSLAKTATLSRGAYYLREGEELDFTYPSKNAFYEEMIWLIWQRQRSLESAD